MKDKILLIDYLAFVYRGVVKFGWGDKEQPAGPSFTIVYNFFRNLRSVVEQFQPTKVFICCEGQNVFRYSLYPDYKNNRIIKTADIKTDKKVATKEDFNRQRDIITNLLPNLPITIVSSEEFEADDVITTLVENLKDEEVVIYSGDKDFIQLLQKGYKNLKLYSPVKNDYVVAPDFNYLTFHTLRGDQIDNIPSIAGPKKAEKLATDIKAFAEFLDSSEENKANYKLNLSLIELKIIPDERLQFVECHTNFAYLKEQFAKMDFKSVVENNYWERFIKTFEGLR